MAGIGLLVSVAVLVWTGGALAAVLGRLAQSLKVSSFLISFVMMAAATTVPELSVGILSSLQGQGSLVFGTAVGSNIANIALVMGVLMLLSGRLRIRSVLRRREASWAAGLALLPVLLAADGTITRAEGVVLLLALGAYMGQLLRSARFFHETDGLKGDPTFRRDLVLFAVLVGVLLYSSHWAVQFAVQVAELLGVPLFVIGLFVLAVGTSLPELVFAIRSAQAGDPLLALGDITGAIVLNATFILGIAALISPIELGAISPYIRSAVVLATLLVYLVLATHSERFTSRVWGLGLLGVYSAFVVAQVTAE